MASLGGFCVKVSFSGELRRFQFPDETEDYFLFLLNQVRSLYCIPAEKNIVFDYEDDEGDHVTMSSLSELVEAVRIAQAANEKVLRINVEFDRSCSNETSSLTSTSTSTSNSRSSPDSSPGSIPSSGSSSGSDFYQSRFQSDNRNWRDAKRSAKAEYKMQKKEIRTQRRVEKEVGKDLSARFVSHITIPDGQILSPGEKFTKTWRFRNEGKKSWPVNAHLIFISAMGDSLGAPSQLPLGVAILPGQEVDISIPCVAPTMAGHYCGYWRLALPCGKKFGQRVWAKIQVV
jgi:hypothetical protein